MSPRKTRLSFSGPGVPSTRISAKSFVKPISLEDVGNKSNGNKNFTPNETAAPRNHENVNENIDPVADLIVNIKKPIRKKVKVVTKKLATAGKKSKKKAANLAEGEVSLEINDNVVVKDIATKKISKSKKCPIIKLNSRTPVVNKNKARNKVKTIPPTVEPIQNATENAAIKVNLQRLKTTRKAKETTVLKVMPAKVGTTHVTLPKDVTSENFKENIITLPKIEVSQSVNEETVTKVTPSEVEILQNSKKKLARKRKGQESLKPSNKVLNKKAKLKISTMTNLCTSSEQSEKSPPAKKSLRKNSKVELSTGEADQESIGVARCSRRKGLVRSTIEINDFVHKTDELVDNTGIYQHIPEALFDSFSHLPDVVKSKTRATPKVQKTINKPGKIGKTRGISKKVMTARKLISEKQRKKWVSPNPPNNIVLKLTPNPSTASEETAGFQNSLNNTTNSINQTTVQNSSTVDPNKIKVSKNKMRAKNVTQTAIKDTVTKATAFLEKSSATKSDKLQLTMMTGAGQNPTERKETLVENSTKNTETFNKPMSKSVPTTPKNTPKNTSESSFQTVSLIDLDKKSLSLSSHSWARDISSSPDLVVIEGKTPILRLSKLDSGLYRSQIKNPSTTTDTDSSVCNMKTSRGNVKITALSNSKEQCVDSSSDYSAIGNSLPLSSSSSTSNDNDKLIADLKCRLLSLIKPLFEGPDCLAGWKKLKNDSFKIPKISNKIPPETVECLLKNSQTMTKTPTEIIANSVQNPKVLNQIPKRTLENSHIFMPTLSRTIETTAQNDIAITRHITDMARNSWMDELLNHISSDTFKRLHSQSVTETKNDTPESRNVVANGVTTQRSQKNIPSDTESSTQSNHSDFNKRKIGHNTEEDEDIVSLYAETLDSVKEASERPAQPKLQNTDNTALPILRRLPNTTERDVKILGKTSECNVQRFGKVIESNQQRFDDTPDCKLQSFKNIAGSNLQRFHKTAESNLQNFNTEGSNLQRFHNTAESNLQSLGNNAGSKLQIVSSNSIDSAPWNNYNKLNALVEPSQSDKSSNLPQLLRPVNDPRQFPENSDKNMMYALRKDYPTLFNEICILNLCQNCTSNECKYQHVSLEEHMKHVESHYKLVPISYYAREYEKLRRTKRKYPLLNFDVFVRFFIQSSINYSYTKVLLENAIDVIYMANEPRSLLQMCIGGLNQLNLHKKVDLLYYKINDKQQLIDILLQEIAFINFVTNQRALLNLLNSNELNKKIELHTAIKIIENTCLLSECTSWFQITNAVFCFVLMNTSEEVFEATSVLLNFRIHLSKDDRLRYHYSNLVANMDNYTKGRSLELPNLALLFDTAEKTYPEMTGHYEARTEDRPDATQAKKGTPASLLNMNLSKPLHRPVRQPWQNKPSSFGSPKFQNRFPPPPHNRTWVRPNWRK